MKTQLNLQKKKFDLNYLKHLITSQLILYAGIAVIGLAIGFFLNRKGKSESLIIGQKVIEILNNNYDDGFGLLYVKMIDWKLFINQKSKIINNIYEYEYEFISDKSRNTLHIGWNSIDNSDPKIIYIEQIDDEGDSILLYGNK